MDPNTISKVENANNVTETTTASVKAESLHDVDLGAEILAAAGAHEPVTQAEMDAVRRKIDWHMVPMLFFCLQLSGWDKVVYVPFLVRLLLFFVYSSNTSSIGTAAIYGLKEDLGMTGSQYSWTGSIMYFAFLLGIFPTLYMLQRFPTGKYLAINITCWGIVELCHAACTNPAGLLVCRFFLGLFQCCDLPAMIIIASMWMLFALPQRTTHISDSGSHVVDQI